MKSVKEGIYVFTLCMIEAAFHFICGMWPSLVYKYV